MVQLIKVRYFFKRGEKVRYGKRHDTCPRKNNKTRAHSVNVSCYFYLQLIKNMINKINKERRRTMNTNPIQQQQESAARSPGGPKTKKRHGARVSTERFITKMILIIELYWI
jgi:hypothetical protein